MNAAFIVFFILLSAAHLYFCYFRIEKLRMLTKPMLLFSLAVYYAFGSASFSPLVLGALLFGFLGDILLLFPPDHKLFLPGAFSFSAGHVLYAVSIVLMMPGARFPWWVIALTVLPYAVAVVAATVRIAPSASRKPMRVMLPMYLALVSLVNVIAWLNLINAVRTGGNAFGAGLITLGAIMFLVSDTVLSHAMFKGGVKHPNFYVMLTYIAAQFCLCAGFSAVC